jgi:hypothetical protein
MHIGRRCILYKLPFVLKGLDGMDKIGLIFFPWRRVFKRLQLQRRWWHRLAVVLFAIALILFLPLAWVYTFTAWEPYPSGIPEIDFWTADSDGNRNNLMSPPPSATQIVPETQQPSTDGSPLPLPPGFVPEQPPQQKPRFDFTKAVPIHASVIMPNGTYSEFVGRSRNDISAEWKKEMQQAVIKQWAFSIVLSLVALLVISYLLQTFYRALVFVIYGPVQNDPDV